MNNLDLEKIAEIVLIAATFITLSQYFQKKVNKSSESQLATENFEIFSRNRQLLLNKISILDHNLDKYFHTLHESGLSELFLIRDELNQIYFDIDRLLSSSKYQEANLLISYLQNPSTKPPINLIKLTTAKLERLQDWDSIANNLVMKCVIQLGIISNKSTLAEHEDLRRKTIHSLDQLRQIIAEERSNLSQ